jgi:hypothetical protein
MPTLVRRTAPAAGLALIAFTACDDATESPVAPDFAVVATHSSQDGAFRVYTQNVYLGGETAPLFSLDLSDIPTVIQATNVFWQQVLASDAPGRAAEIVERIDVERPHVIGLQEVLQFVLLDGTFQPTGGLDLLTAIEAEIGARGLPYVTEIVQPTTSAALPMGTDGVGITRWLGFTDRLVTLRREDVDVVDTDGGLYAAGIPLAPGVTIRRGWSRTTLDFAGTPYHFLNTHLETQSAPPVQAAQGAELRASVLAGLDGVTILAGDLNSNAAADPSDPTWTPTYGDLVADGFIDVWRAAPPSGTDAGLTCCHPSDLVGVLDFDQRIDFVLARSSDHEHGQWDEGRGHFRAEVVGEEAEDRTDTGLWPSDHAGLVAALHLPWRFSDEGATTRSRW